VRAIARAAVTSKPVIGVMSALPVFGMPPSPMTGGQPMEPQVFVGELRRDYTVKRVGLDPEKIDDDIKVLLGDPPARKSASGRSNALDQFVLRGGKLHRFPRPERHFDQLGQMGAWAAVAHRPRSTGCSRRGPGFDSGKVVLGHALPHGAERAPCRRLLSLTTMLSNPNDIATARLGSCSCPLPGAFTGSVKD